MKQNNLTVDVDVSKKDKLKAELTSMGFRFHEVEHAFWRAISEGIIVILYKNGTLLLQGKDKDTEIILNRLASVIIDGQKKKYQRWIGTDEAGKGDYFGPLIVAGVLMNPAKEILLWKAGVKDSKFLANEVVAELGDRIKKSCSHAIITIMPKKYNDLQKKMRNLNRLLAWAHARAIENILQEEECYYALSDQFGDEKFITNALLERGKKIEIEQRPKAEEDIAVAAASILARGEFIRRLKTLSEQFSLSFPKGASKEVVKVGREFVRIYGPEKLGEVAKLHFRTTKDILGRNSFR